MPNRISPYTERMNDHTQHAEPSHDGDGSPLKQTDSVRLQLVSTAYHEAGHAVMALALGRLVQKVTIRPGRSRVGEVRLGVCELGKGKVGASKDLVEDEAMILFAGMVAEARFTGQYCEAGAAQDLRAIRRLLQSRAGSERQMERLERRFLNKTEHILQDTSHVQAIELIACELLQKVTISGRAVRHFFNQAIQQAS
jgi:hypothetical protein